VPCILRAPHGKQRVPSSLTVLLARGIVRNTFLRCCFNILTVFPADVIYLEESFIINYGTFTVSNCKNFNLNEYRKYPPFIPSLISYLCCLKCTVIYWDDGSWTAYDTVTIANNVGGEYGGLLLASILLLSTNFLPLLQLCILTKEAASASMSHSSFPTTLVTTVAEAIGKIVASCSLVL